MEKLNPPALDEIEVSVFGGGNGYGECIVIHASYDNWIIVDSAKDPKSKQPLALSYLDELGIPIEQDVKLIIATHWHDDHVSGIAEVFRYCQQAVFACSQALNQKQFLVLLGQADKISSNNSGIREFRAVFEQISTQQKSILRAIQDRVLLNMALPDESLLEVFTLSPSDKAIQHFENQLATLVKETAANKAVTAVSPNHSSVVTVVRIGNDCICLGGDLETTKDQDTGWDAILNAQLLPQKNISVFKVPHHGSSNAYAPEFWGEAIKPDNIAALTPYARGRKKLPAPEDVKNIYRHTSNAFITAPTRAGKEKKRPVKENKIIRSLGYEVREIPFDYGHICLRKKIGQDEPWRIELRGKAVELKRLLESTS